MPRELALKTPFMLTLEKIVIDIPKGCGCPVSVQYNVNAPINFCEERLQTHFEVTKIPT